MSSDKFSLKEKQVFFMKKWRKEHKALLIISAASVILSVIIPLALRKPWFIGISPLLACCLYAYQHNKMMAYVENNIYEKGDSK